MGKWQNLTAKQKAGVIRFAIQNGVSDINTIRDTYNLYSNGNQEEILNKVNSSNANFVQRLKDPNRKNIPDWESPTDRISTHKLSVGTDENGNHYIFPEVQEINDELVDFTRPPYHRFAGEISAEMRGDTVRVPSIEDAIKFTQTYKQYYQFNNGGNLAHKKSGEEQGESQYLKLDDAANYKAYEDATKHGKSAQEFARQILANKENYSPAMVKKANFARNAAHWHDEGGYLGREFENGGKKKIADSPLYKQSAKIMEGVRRIRNYENLTGYNQADCVDYLNQFMEGYRGDPYALITPSGTPQDTYLLPAKMFDKALLEAGYTHGQSGDYGTVNKAATNLGQRLNRDISVYQAYPDAISKDSLIHLGSDVELIGALGHTYPGKTINPVILEHAGDYASSYYMSPITGQLYLKGWDLNDYSPASQGHNSYNNTLTTLSVVLDKIGNPAVYTTGFQPAKSVGQAIFMEGAYPNPDTHRQAYRDKNLSYKEQMRAFNMALDAELRLDAINEVLTPLMKKKGLYKHVVDGQYFFSPLEEEVVVTPNKKSTGGPLYPFSFEKNPYLKTPVVRYDEGGKTYTVKSGDYLGKIAQANGITIADILAVNPGLNADKINIGQVLNIPGKPNITRQQLGNYIKTYKNKGWTEKDIDYLYSKLSTTDWDPSAIVYAMATESSFNPASKNPVTSAKGLAQITDATMRSIYGTQAGDSINNLYTQKKVSTQDAINHAFDFYNYAAKKVTSERDDMSYGRLKTNLLAPNAGRDSKVSKAVKANSLTEEQKGWVNLNKTTYRDLAQKYDSVFNTDFYQPFVLMKK